MKHAGSFFLQSLVSGWLSAFEVALYAFCVLSCGISCFFEKKRLLLQKKTHLCLDIVIFIIFVHR